MNLRTLVRNATAAALFAAIPLSSVSSMASTPAPTVSAVQAQRIAHLKTKGAAEIDRRIANLTAALQKLSASTKLATDNKTALTQQVQSEISGLTSLKTKLAAETTLTGARADVQSIITDYRVYVLMLPKARLVAADDRFSVSEAKLNELATKLQTRITALKSNGKDVASLQASLDDMKAKTASAQGRTAGLVTKLLSLQPTDYNANHALLVSYRDALKAAQADLKTARDDAKTIITAMKTAK
jgi:chromosome segregation ATPase